MKKTIRYAVYGLGHIAQVAMLPAFKHAGKNSELVALVSGDGVKLRELGKKYKVKTLVHYDQYESLLASGLVDAIYIATPNTMHVDAAELALTYGRHVLCEKPLGVDEESCARLVRAARAGRAMLMVGYRLHFNAANLHALELAKSGKLGDLRVFNSTFTMQIEDRQNIRLDAAKGGGPLYDIGIYCINAARALFGAEPISVTAMAESKHEARFREVDEMVSVSMRFPRNRLANFVASFGAADTARYHLIGTEGHLSLESAYDYATKMELSLKVGERTTKRSYPKRDQFAPELVYFSECIRKGRAPEPAAEEGLADVRVIRAIQKSIDTGREVAVSGAATLLKPKKLSPKQKIWRRPVKKPELVRVQDAQG